MNDPPKESLIVLERVSEQIQDTYKIAFIDLLEQSLKSDLPDYEWVISLYKEIRDRLTQILEKLIACGVTKCLPA